MLPSAGTAVALRVLTAPLAQQHMDQGFGRRHAANFGFSSSSAPAAAPGVSELRVLKNSHGQTSARHHPARAGERRAAGGMVLIKIQAHQMAQKATDGSEL